MQNWSGYSGPAMEESLYETTILQQFARLSLARISDGTTIPNFGPLLEKHELATGMLPVTNGYVRDRGLSLKQDTIVDATLIDAPVSTKNKGGKRYPEMRQAKKSNRHYFRAEADIGVDDGSGPVHSLAVTSANVADVIQVNKLLHGKENIVYGDAGYTNVEKRAEHKGRQPLWVIKARLSMYRKYGKGSALHKAFRGIEREGQRSGKARIYVSGDQVPVRPPQGSLSWAELERRSKVHSVCAIQSWMTRHYLLANEGEMRA